MKEVAKLAGVSPATVSYVINSLSEINRIPPQTQRAVWRACKKLNYEPDYLATSLATRKTGIIGILFSTTDNYFVAQILGGLQEVVRKHRKQVALCITDNNAQNEEHDLKLLHYRRVDGIIAFPVWSESRQQYWSLVSEANLPCIFIDHPPHGIGGNCIQVDNSQLGSQAAKLLHQEGVRETILVASRQQVPTLKMRETAFARTIEELCLPKPKIVYSDDLETICALLQNTKGHHGFFAPRGDYLVKPARLIAERRKAIHPQHCLASIGYESHACFASNKWWMARMPATEMGRLAAEHMINKLKEQEQSPFSLVLPCSWEGNHPDMEFPRDLQTQMI